MRLLIIVFLKTTDMKLNWKKILLYIIKIMELVITGAAGEAIGGNL